MKSRKNSEIDFYQATAPLSVPLPLSGDQLPTDIQWMPPGEHPGVALMMRTATGWEPTEVMVRVHAGTAQRLQTLLQSLRAKASEGLEDVPYFDFNHEDGAASGRPLEFYWAGTDPKTGGVRVKVEWTEPGKQALLGRAYRRFSPQFRADATGEVTGAPLNMGGLVNRAAFKTIQPVVAGAAGDHNERKARRMDADQMAADLAAERTKNAELQAKLTAAQSDQTLKAKDAEILTLKGRITELETKIATGAKEAAKAIVAAAVKAGKLAPQNTDLQAKWTDAIAANPDLAATLNDLPPNPALATVVAGGAGPAGGTTSAAAGEHQFVAKAKDIAAQHKITFADATVQLAGREPALYEDYCRALAPKEKRA